MEDFLVDALEEEAKSLVKPGWQLWSDEEIRQFDEMMEKRGKEIYQLREECNTLNLRLRKIELYIANLDERSIAECPFCKFTEDRKYLVHLCKMHSLLLRKREPDVKALHSEREA